MAVDQETLLEDVAQAIRSPGRPPEPRPLSLRANSSWMLAGNTVYALCQWAMLTVLARLGTPTMVGQFVLALAVTTPVMAMLLLQLRSVQATDARRQYQFGDYLALRLSTAVLAVVTVGVICLVARLAGHAGYGGETGLILLAAAISAAVDSVSDIIYGFLQQRERLDRVAQSMMIKGVLAVTTLAAVVLATGQLALALLGIAFCRLLTVWSWDLRNARLILEGQTAGGPGSATTVSDLRPCWDLTKMFALGRLAFPLGMAMMLVVLCSNMPRYFVENELGQHFLGIFGALAYLGTVGTTVVGALGESATPRLAQFYAAGQRRAFGRLLAGLVAVGAGLGIAGVAVAWLAGPPILRILYGVEYADHSSLLVWMMAAAGTAYVATFTGYAVTAARYFRVQMPLLVAVVLVTAGVCTWLVPAYGMLGAAWAMGASSLAQLVGRCLILAHALVAKTEARAGVDADGRRPSIVFCGGFRRET